MKYLVLADRYGTGLFVYPIGIFDTLALALEKSEKHRTFRGGKYDHRIYELNPNTGYDAGALKYTWAHTYTKG